MTTPKGPRASAPSDEILDAIIRNALAEDLGDGDITTEHTLPPGAELHGDFLAKEDGVIAGLHVARRVFALAVPARAGATGGSPLVFRADLSDGDTVARGQHFASVRGSGRAILSGERVALNFLQRMSGIATATRRYVEAVRGTRAAILDTRKTAPGLRILDKWAVTLGGGRNHRFGLFDMALIKDNHIAAVGSITEAVRRVRAGDPRRRPIEVEVTSLGQLEETLALAVDRILLDNMSPEAMRAAVAMAGGRIPLEASGGVSLATVAEVAATGVDFISIGALTHSVKALDISLDIRAS